MLAASNAFVRDFYLARGWPLASVRERFVLKMPTDIIYFTWFGVHIQLFPAARVPNEITLSLYRGKAWVFKTYIYIFFIYPTSFVFTTLVWQLYEGSRKAVAGQCNKREMIESIFFPFLSVLLSVFCTTLIRKKFNWPITEERNSTKSLEALSWEMIQSICITTGLTICR